MEDKTMIATEIVALLMSIIAVLCGATHHLILVIGLGILTIVHINTYINSRRVENEQ
ncbi:MAG: hypothetical protein J6R25_00550 [Bacteroidales bacterium]|nr:hypothetical protein [Bacteroidales bacterium]